MCDMNRIKELETELYELTGVNLDLLRGEIDRLKKTVDILTMEIAVWRQEFSEELGCTASIDDARFRLLGHGDIRQAVERRSGVKQ